VTNLDRPSCQLEAVHLLQSLFRILGLPIGDEPVPLRTASFLKDRLWRPTINNEPEHYFS
jgi:hypothetical protein